MVVLCGRWDGRGGGGGVACGGGTSMVFLAVGEGTDRLRLKDGCGKVWVMLLAFVGSAAGLLGLMAARGMGVKTNGSYEFVLRLGLLKFRLGFGFVVGLEILFLLS